MKKLTLSMEGETIAEAKRLAAERGTSVSAMFSRIVQAMAQQRGKPRELGPITRRATDLVKLPAERSDRELLEEALMEKHGLTE